MNAALRSTCSSSCALAKISTNNALCSLPRFCAQPFCGSALVTRAVSKPKFDYEEILVPSHVCRSMDPRGGGKAASGFQFNVAYAAIVGAYGLLFLFKNPYIFAALSILTIIPQNSAITSLNSLVILFYDSGLFMNFAEAVYCVRLMTCSFGVEATGYVRSLLREQLLPSRRLHVGLLQNDCVDQQGGLMEERDHTQLLELHGSPSEPAIVVCHNLPPFLGRPTPRWRSCEPCPPPGLRELVRIPADFVAALNSMDEIWVPTEASRIALSNSGVVRSLHVVPLGIDTQELDRTRVRPTALPPPNAVQVFGPLSGRKPSFAFISVFKWELRKGYDVLLRAFLEEFGAASRHQVSAPERFREEDSDFSGTAKAKHRSHQPSGSALRPTGVQALTKTAAATGDCEDPDVALYILTKPFLPGEPGPGLEGMRGVMVVTGSCYQRLGGHGRFRQIASFRRALAGARVRGLPITEAMSLGLTVIATNWSGPSAYLDEEVGYPLSYRLEAVPSSEPYWYQGSQWAEPSVIHLRQLMRTVASCSGRGDAKARGEAARQRVIERYSQPVVARLVAAELRRIADLTPIRGQGAGARLGKGFLKAELG
ncbi:hypothetical protein VOLCADRAFT_104071 [Volvox carteri f. nagariensis]|uniref:Glycosyl transferase family 1 domain-containing protein n=1 Tax=Volvox carteri f. nagariensis TaxID=3068 RepID=D8TR14_VOLCA|nr:uncharacterized protein VOLCADRAFT_104071 [Volvox carteri f. nagariensis]EFJ50257.1 hypothetical protein VOLCADRAFT_104071 [Volvox carteri f. nagariensis]|eukprot:XP_002948877.1 hypothetical protein VOLCADRAFT_104071 [Volvox carteri f. nagariensis]